MTGGRTGAEATSIRLEAQIQASTRASSHLGAYRWEAAKVVELVQTPDRADRGRRPTQDPDRCHQGARRRSRTRRRRRRPHPARSHNRSQACWRRFSTVSATSDPRPRGKIPVKIVVAGGFGVGKSTFVNAISEIEPLRSEAMMTAASSEVDNLVAHRREADHHGGDGLRSHRADRGDRAVPVRHARPGTLPLHVERAVAWRDRRDRAGRHPPARRLLRRNRLLRGSQRAVRRRRQPLRRRPLPRPAGDPRGRAGRRAGTDGVLRRPPTRRTSRAPSSPSSSTPSCANAPTPPPADSRNTRTALSPWSPSSACHAEDRDQAALEASPFALVTALSATRGGW